MKYSGLSAALVAMLAIIACKQTVTTTTTTNKPATEETPTEPDEKEENGGASDDAGTGGGGKKDSAPPEEPQGECGGESTQQGCINCCVTKHETGSDVYFVALFDCVCQASQCATACADTMCNEENPQNPDAACNACMAEKNATCQQSVAAACSAEPDCLAFDKCVGESVCTAKN